MDKEQEQRLVDYYSATDRYEKNERHSETHQSVYTKESDRGQWLVLEQKGRNGIEARQTDSHGKIMAWDNYDLTGRIPKCTSVVRLHGDGHARIPFNADEINVIYQFGEQGKAETCAQLSAILPHIKEDGTRQVISSTLDKVKALSEASCTELIATTKRRKTAERDHSIRARLARAKEQIRKPTVAEQEKDKSHSRGKAGMEL